MSKFAIVLAAAGKSTRFHDPNHKKPFANLSGKAVWLYSAEAFLKRNDVKQVIMVVSPEDCEDFVSRFAPNMAVLGIDLVKGGESRSDSVWNGVQKVDPDIDYVAIHDAARPCIADVWVDKVFDAAKANGCAILATPVASTIKMSVSGKSVDKTIDRSNLYLAQTPQVFERQRLVDCFQNCQNQKTLGKFTDESQMVESVGHKVQMIEGSPMNIKITTKQDLALAGAILKVLPQPKFDAPTHPFKDDIWR